MSSLFFSSSRSPLSVALRRFTLCRFSSIVTYATEEEKSRFIHPSSVVHPNAILGEFGNECFLEIGDNNEIREHVSIHRSSTPSDKTVIGDNNLIMGSCHIAHDCKVGNNNILANSTLLAGHVVVEDYAHTAGGIVVHQFCHIGSYAFIGGGSVVSQDVPKYTIVSGERAELRGLNLEGLRRRGFSCMEIKSLRAAYREIFMPTDISSGNIEDRLSQVVLSCFEFFD